MQKVLNLTQSYLFNYAFVAYAFWCHIHEITAKNLKKTQKKFFVDTKTWALMIGFKMHFGSWGRTGRPGLLPPTGSPRVGQDCVTEQQQDPPRLRPQALFHFSLVVVRISSEFSKPLPATLLRVCPMYVTQEWAQVCRFICTIRDPFLFWDFSLLVLLILGLLLLVSTGTSVPYHPALSGDSVLSAKSIKKQVGKLIHVVSTLSFDFPPQFSCFCLI